MAYEFTTTGYLPLIVDDLTIVQEIECEVTISMEDDGCGEMIWSPVMIDCANLTGTGWVRFKEIQEPHTLRHWMAEALFKAAKSDSQLEEAASAAWAEFMKEAA